MISTILADLQETLKKDRKYSSWSRKQTLTNRLHTIIDEVQEALREVDGANTEKLCDEMGDILIDVFACFAIAEEQELFTVQESAQKALEKLKRRKPWIFEEKNISSEEEVRLWNTAKQEEKRLAGNK